MQKPLAKLIDEFNYCLPKSSVFQILLKALPKHHDSDVSAHSAAHDDDTD